MTWLPGFERIPSARASGGSYVDGVPWRFVAHTTEVVPSSVVGARALAGRHEYPPHLWVWPEKKWRAQTVPLNRSAFALLHPSGTPETNKMRALQVEIIGHAKDTPGWPEEWWAWLGEQVLAPVIAAGYPIDLTNVAPTTGGDGYGAGGAVRMSRAAWRGFDGVCCHANVPDNHHWDIGDGRLDLIARYAQGDDVALTDDDKQWLRDLMAIATGDRTTVDGAPRSDVYRWDRETVTIVRALKGEVAALRSAVSQLGAGGSVDYGKVKDAVKTALREGSS